MRLSVCIALLLAACAPVQNRPPENPTEPASAVRLSVERVSPNSMRLTLDNGERHPIGYNLCSSGLQRRTGTTWAAVQTDDVCTMEIRTLNPGADATFEKRLSPDLAPGEYRYVTAVESPVGTAQIGVASDAFTLP